MNKRFRILSLALLSACLIGCSGDTTVLPSGTLANQTALPSGTLANQTAPPSGTLVNGNSQLIPVHEYDAESIEQSVATEIKRAYYQKLVSESLINPNYDPNSPEDLWISWYVGNFNGCEVVMIAGDGLDFTEAERPVEVAGYVIVFADGQPVYVYNDSGFYTVKEAYDNGLITKSDVYSIGVGIGVGFTESYPTE